LPENPTSILSLSTIPAMATLLLPEARHIETDRRGALWVFVQAMF